MFTPTRVNSSSKFINVVDTHVQQPGIKYDKEEGRDDDEKQTRDISMAHFVIVTLIMIGTAIGFTIVISFTDEFMADVIFPPLSSTHNSGLDFLVQIESNPLRNYSKLTPSEYLALFEGYQDKFSKSYESEAEKMLYFDSFKENLRAVDAHNAANEALGGMRVFGLTKFTDLPYFPNRYLIDTGGRHNRGAKKAIIPKFLGNISEIDWSQRLATRIKTQGIKKIFCLSPYSIFVCLLCDIM